jgi:hypothetical protein
MFYFLFFFKIHLQRLIPIIKVKGLTYNLTRARLYYAQPLCCWSWLWRAGHFDNNSNRIWPAISNLKLIVQRMTLAHAHIEKYLSRETWIHPLAIIDNYVPVMPCRCRSFFFSSSTSLRCYHVEWKRTLKFICHSVDNFFFQSILSLDLIFFWLFPPSSNDWFCRSNQICTIFKGTAIYFSI